MSIVSVTKKVRFCNNYGFDFFSTQTSKAWQENISCLKLPTEGKLGSNCGLFSNSVCVFCSVIDTTHLGTSKEKKQGPEQKAQGVGALATLEDQQGFVPSPQNHLYFHLQGIWHPLLVSADTASTWCTYIRAGKHLYTSNKNQET